MSGPHISAIVEPCSRGKKRRAVTPPVSRSGNIANPPTATTQVSSAANDSRGTTGRVAAPTARPDMAWE